MGCHCLLQSFYRSLKIRACKQNSLCQILFCSSHHIYFSPSVTFLHDPMVWFPWWLKQKRISLQCGRPVFHPWVGKSPWTRAWPHSSILAWRIPWTVAAQAPRRISQARILEQVDISFYRGSFQPRDGTWVSCITGQILYHLSHQGKPHVFFYFFCGLITSFFFLKCILV